MQKLFESDIHKNFIQILPCNDDFNIECGLFSANANSCLMVRSNSTPIQRIQRISLPLFLLDDNSKTGKNISIIHIFFSYDVFDSVSTTEQR